MPSQNNSDKFIVIGTVDDKGNPDDAAKTTLDKLDGFTDLLKSGKKVFIFIFMEGCGHCDDAKPEWYKLESDKFGNDTVFVMLNQKLLYDTNNESILNLIEQAKAKANKTVVLKTIEKLKKQLGKSPIGFPTFKKISGSVIEEYDGDRDEKSFTEWVEGNKKSTREKLEDGEIKEQKGWLVGGRGAILRGGASLRGGGKRTRKSGKSRKVKKGGKWSRKYKKSINCKRPKGFSQKQYCKYGNK
jgi:thiol-disulfide isomerase/thioredoxin